MRAYFYTNMYLSSLQVGLQSAHVVAELFRKYAKDSEQKDILNYWADQHKTIIILNAGYSEEIRKLVDGYFVNVTNPYPWAKFHEGVDALDGALTAAGIVLPEHVYDVDRWTNVPPPVECTDKPIFTYGGKDCLDLDWQEGMIYHVNAAGASTPISNWEFQFAQNNQRYGLAR